MYTKIRARIWLRINGEALTDENVDLEVERIRAIKGGFLSEQDVIAPLERGEEVRKSATFFGCLMFLMSIFQQHIDVIRMECVGYDHAFVHDLESRLKNLNAATTTTNPPKTMPGRAARKSAGSARNPDSAVEANPNDAPSGLRRSSRIKRPPFHLFFASSDEAQSSGVSDYDLVGGLEEDELIFDW